MEKKDENINSTFNVLNNKIGNLDRKIVVFIDDIDRLDKEEIFEILKLIRKTANFQNTFFVVAYDRNYVNNSIKEHSGASVIKYLDKIINIEINLPYFDKILLKNYFTEHLKSVIPALLHYKIDYFVKSYEKDPLLIDLGFDEDDLFLYWLNNFREIKKIINSIIVNYNNIYKQVNFVDVIHLEILKLKHPFLYSLLFIKQNELLSVYKESNCYYLTPLDKVKSSNQQFKEFLDKKNNPNPSFNSIEKIITVFDFYLEKYLEDNNINNIEKERILDLIDRLFIRWDDKNTWNFNLGMDIEDNLSVKYVNKFERYFSHTIFPINISEDEFEEFIFLEEDELRAKIISWTDEIKLNDLGFRLNKNFDFKNEKEYKNTIIASLILLRMNKGGLNIHQLIGKMFGINLVPKIFANVDSAKQFFINLFSSSKDSFLFEAQILNELSKRNSRRPDPNDPEKFPLTDDEINIILKRFITDYIDNDILFNNEFWSLYFMCQKLSATTNKEPFEDVNQLIYTKLESGSMKILFLKSLVIYDGYGYQSIIRKGAIENLFGSLENFENNFLNTANDEAYILRFREYYASSKNANWEYIDFEHDFIKESIHNK
ncbi:KAP family P-loop domain protein [Elizabethkingia miricola]|nr:KAP family P-loop domain protein [Elizabethkingia miricola]